MNWTSTVVPMWQIDCDRFLNVGRPFELRDIRTEEHEKFVEAFAKTHYLRVTVKDQTARFEKIETKEGPN